MINIMTKLLMVFAKLTQISHKLCLDWSTNSICLYYHYIEFSIVAFKTLSSCFPFLIALTLLFLEAWFGNGFEFMFGALSKVIHPAFISCKSCFVFNAKHPSILWSEILKWYSQFWLGLYHYGNGGCNGTNRIGAIWPTLNNF